MRLRPSCAISVRIVCAPLVRLLYYVEAYAFGSRASALQDVMGVRASDTRAHALGAGARHRPSYAFLAGRLSALWAVVFLPCELAACAFGRCADALRG